MDVKAEALADAELALAQRRACVTPHAVRFAKSWFTHHGFFPANAQS